MGCARAHQAAVVMLVDQSSRLNKRMMFGFGCAVDECSQAGISSAGRLVPQAWLPLHSTGSSLTSFLSCNERDIAAFESWNSFAMVVPAFGLAVEEFIAVLGLVRKLGKALHH